MDFVSWDYMDKTSKYCINFAFNFTSLRSKLCNKFYIILQTIIYVSIHYTTKFYHNSNLFFKLNLEILRNLSSVVLESNIRSR